MSYACVLCSCRGYPAACAVVIQCHDRTRPELMIRDGAALPRTDCALCCTGITEQAASQIYTPLMANVQIFHDCGAKVAEVGATSGVDHFSSLNRNGPPTTPPVGDTK